jgi:hypothetical protein
VRSSYRLFAELTLSFYLYRDVPAGFDHAEGGGQGEERLLNVDWAPPGERARAEGHAGEGQGGEQEGGVPAQARQVLLNMMKNRIYFC